MSLIDIKNKISPSRIYLFKVTSDNTTAMFKICSKLTTKTPERRHLRRSYLFIVSFGVVKKNISVVEFEQVNVSWDRHLHFFFSLSLI